MYSEEELRVSEDKILQSVQAIKGLIQKRREGWFLVEESMIEDLFSEFERAYLYYRRYLTIMQRQKDGRKKRYVPTVLNTDSVDGVMEITETDYGFDIRMPLLLESKRRRGENLLAANLAAYLEEYVHTNPITKIKDCNMVIHQIYDCDMNVRDCDNVETSQIINVLGTYLFHSDSGTSCYQMHTAETKIGSEECTRIYLIDRRKFPKFWGNHTDAEGNFRT